MAEPFGTQIALSAHCMQQAEDLMLVAAQSDQSRSGCSNWLSKYNIHSFQWHYWQSRIVANTVDEQLQWHPCSPNHCWDGSG
jgi:hypothetical protein